jgi:hypothetical protein
MHAGALFAGRVAEVSRFPCRATASTLALLLSLWPLTETEIDRGHGVCVAEGPVHLLRSFAFTRIGV